jgi:hypothetical protein
MGILGKTLAWTAGTVFFVIVVVADDISTRARIKSGANKEV